MVAILLRKNPEASVKDKNGMSAYYYAKKGGMKEIAEHLPAEPYDEWKNVPEEMIKAAADGGGGKKKGKKKKK
eukprot:CAMPEP_0167820684 /NCGR_PEP_ID=MMETSP0112_2-20121227/6253_1 /TAXON_ID=91324 /ORGANISM="Lotharella globosa, Strain CCCM811" /LENGTH=72 /DNA_ID=CAMNT_0007721319 /DNA_START=355 /DNA_END=573 /DNA_ORIENTATION=+